MATPIPDIRVDWRNDGFNLVSNDGFETNTSGWSTSAGIAGAATSITRSTADFYMGAAMAIVVTTGTDGSGVKWDFGSTTFTSGRTYRYRLYAKSVSGTTSGKMILGSLGTGADRGTSTFTLTTSWAAYTVDWTPSGTRTDVELTFGNNTAAVMTARIDAVESFEAIDDISAYCDYLTWTRGANFDGSEEAPGQTTFRLRNHDGRFSPDNTSSPLTGLLKLGRPVWIRATYGGATYACFYGAIRRITPLPDARFVEIVAEDPLYRLGRQETSIELSLSRSIRDFRVAILADIAEPVAAQQLAYGVESDIVYTEADQVNALSVLSDLNKATGTVHYIKPQVSSTAPYKYTTIDRAGVQGQVVDETFNDDLTDMANYDLTDELLVNSQRVFPTARRLLEAPEVVWEGDVPMTIDVDTTVWAGRRGGVNATANTDVTFADPTFSQTLTIDGTGITGTVFTPFSRSAKIVIQTATGAEVDTLFITGIPAPQISGSSVVIEDLSVITERYAGSDIASEFIASPAMAEGLARWWVYRYKGGAARPTITLQGRFPSQLQRDITDRVAITFSLLGITAKEFLIRSLTTTIDMGAASCITTYGLEATPTALNLFTIDGTAAQGLGGTGVLGY